MNRKAPTHIAAAKALPPSNAESYNPPAEYLPTEKELKEWDDLDVEDRPYGLVVPKIHPNLRSVGAYDHAVRERFERCLNLYLAPRALKKRLNIDPESLVPQLPKASDLKPYPTTKCIRYVTPSYPSGGAPKIRDLSVSPSGQYLCTGAEDGVVRMWEVQTSRLLKSWDLSALLSNDKVGVDDLAASSSSSSSSSPPTAISCVSFNPALRHNVILACCGSSAFVIATGTGNEVDCSVTEALIDKSKGMRGGGEAGGEGTGDTGGGRAKSSGAKWSSINPATSDSPISKFSSVSGPVSKVTMSSKVTSCRWHHKGDYFVTVSPSSGASSVLIHQLSKVRTQQPFSKKSSGNVQACCFHPNKPFLFVASSQSVRVYHLVRQRMVKKLRTGSKFVTSVDVHATGDHVIVGTLDRKVLWFDLDLGDCPYKSLKYHSGSVRSARFHPRYPLMCSCGDDGFVHVFHCAVYDDLMRNPLIVPVKVIDASEVKDRLGTLAVKWHPDRPWAFTAGADGEVFCWQDI